MQQLPATTAPTVEDIIALADRALAEIPAPLARHVRGVGIVVEEIADDETLDAMGIESPFDLTGLYRGVPMHRKSITDVPSGPEMIFLYRQPILLEWIETGEDLFRLVRNVLIHEIAHHFGFSDDEIDALEGRLR
ncbi:MAG TPA: metallopeptidase family protein [Acetobacteraceae bacterium]|jgi:acetylglutamate kinase|nr:metallopeptidase family protein [Acetobacteraceae bacterium]